MRIGKEEQGSGHRFRRKAETEPSGLCNDAMADEVKIRRGNKATIPTLAVGELAYCKDAKELYIGTASGNVLLCANATITKVTGLETNVSALQTAVNGKLTASKVAAQSELDGAADLVAVITAFNTLVAAMKSSGVMNT